MTETNKTPTAQWSGAQTNALAVVLLLAGMVGGWFIRGPQNAAAAGSTRAAGSLARGEMMASAATQPAASQLKEMADAQAAPLLNKLASAPGNFDLLASIGNVYYDSQQYVVAIDYYKRALSTKPSDASVRTDMATAYWYTGDADAAIAEFNKALAYAPNNPSTLFNLGLVKWKGKSDITGATADWQRLLATSPNYEGRDKVQQMIDEAKRHEHIQSQTIAK